MDLLCTENINNEDQQQQQQKHHQDNHHHHHYYQHQHHPYQQCQDNTTSANKNASNSVTPQYTNTSISINSNSNSAASLLLSNSSTTSSGYNSLNSEHSCSAVETKNNNNAKVNSSDDTNDTCCLDTAADLIADEDDDDEDLHAVDQLHNKFQEFYGQEKYYYNTLNVYATNRLNRTLDYVNTATEDPTFRTDRCLENALKAEEKRPHPVCTYFKTVQKDITPPMRKIVAEWMMEVCAEEKCQEEVVLLALNYMDRFLSTKSVLKTHLQILAAACLLLASKLREPSCRALSAELLVFYTDNSIYKGDLIKWELFVLSRLGWDLSSVTPLDFLELLLMRLPIKNTKCPDLNIDKVRQHAQAFISLAAKEHDFSMYSASTIAASSIAAALSGLHWLTRTGKNLSDLLNLLTDLTSVQQELMGDCMKQMEYIFQEHCRQLQPYLVSAESKHHHHHQHQQQQQQQQRHYHSHHMATNHDSMNNVVGATIILPDLTQTCKMQANAQKDVQDIKF